MYFIASSNLAMKSKKNPKFSQKKSKYLDSAFVFLGDQEAGREGAFHHVDEHVVGEHVQLFNLLALDVDIACHAEPGNKELFNLLALKNKELFNLFALKNKELFNLLALKNKELFNLLALKNKELFNLLALKNKELFNLIALKNKELFNLLDLKNKELFNLLALYVHIPCHAKPGKYS